MKNSTSNRYKYRPRTKSRIIINVADSITNYLIQRWWRKIFLRNFVPPPVDAISIPPSSPSVSFSYHPSVEIYFSPPAPYRNFRSTQRNNIAAAVFIFPRNRATTAPLKSGVSNVELKPNSRTRK